LRITRQQESTRNKCYMARHQPTCQCKEHAKNCVIVRVTALPLVYYCSFD